MHQSLIKSRTSLLAIIILGAMAIFVLRLFWLQIIQHDSYVATAQKSQQKSFVIPARRGEIYMMDGQKPVPVVLNQTTYTVIADPNIVKDSQKVAIIEAIQEIAGGEVVGKIEAKLANKKSRYEVLAKDITRSQAEKLKKKDFVGVLYQQGSIRSYPEGSLAAHVLGFVNAEGAGQYGVEGGLNDRLKGSDGLLRAVTDVRYVPLTIGQGNLRVEPKQGENIALSIDRNIQNFAEEALKRGVEKAGATEGSVLVVKPGSGQILAMANFPTFVPSEYFRVKDAKVFMNTTTMVPYEPASVIKSFMFATAIDKGAVTPQSTYVNTDQLQVADRIMGNALRGNTGTLTMQQVLNLSLNTGTITAARRLGDGSSVNQAARKTMYEYYHDRFGLGEKTGVEVGEARGYIFPPDSPEGNEVTYSAMTFGQGLNLTMIQVAAGFCSIINGGQYFQPTVIDGQMNQQGSLTMQPHKPLRRTISEKSSLEMRNMLSTARGSYFGARDDKTGYQIGGKTGTAESVIDGQYTKKETVATYLGFGGASEPEYVIMVRVAAPGKGINLEGGIHAGPVFTEISNWMIDYMKLAPRR